MKKNVFILMEIMQKNKVKKTKEVVFLSKAENFVPHPRNCKVTEKPYPIARSPYFLH
jgi:hypothetical protein